MAAVDIDPQLLLSAFLRVVRRNFTTVTEQIDWLARLQQQALIGSSTGIESALATMQDHSSSAVTSDGTSTQWLREMSAPTIAALCEAALQRIEADDAAGGVGAAPSSSVQHSDFSRGLSILG